MRNGAVNAAGNYMDSIYISVSQLTTSRTGMAMEAAIYMNHLWIDVYDVCDVAVGTSTFRRSSTGDDNDEDKNVVSVDNNDDGDNGSRLAQSAATTEVTTMSRYMSASTSMPPNHLPVVDRNNSNDDDDESASLRRVPGKGKGGWVRCVIGSHVTGIVEYDQ